MKKLISDGESLTPEMLNSLGTGVSVLPPSMLSSFSRDALTSTMFSLSQAEWKPAQAKILAQKLLEKVQATYKTSTLSCVSCPCEFF